MIDIERRKRSRTRGREGGSRPRANNFMEYTGDASSTAPEEMASHSYKNSGAILSI